MNISFSHIGWAVRSIPEALPSFSVLGYELTGKCVEDQDRNIRIALIENEEGIVIELIEAMSDKSPVSNILRLLGPSPYHICAAISVRKEWIELKKKLMENGFAEIIPEKYSSALHHKYGDRINVIFMYNKNLGLMEFAVHDQ